MKRIIYLDHNATTPVNPEVLKAIIPFYKSQYGNASSLHSKGREARNAVDKAREILGDFLGTEPEDIIFTSGGTESDNFAIKGTLFRNKDTGRDHIITSKIEHQAVLSTCKYLEKKGVRVTYVDVDKYGIVDLNQIKDSIAEKACLITIMHANNEVGTIQPIKEIARIAKEKGVYFHTDAIQSFCKIPTGAKELGVDMLSISAHKIYGPKGVGALYIRKGVKIEPYQHGGHHERSLRAGTENVAGIVGLGKAVELLKEDYLQKAQRIQMLRDRLHKGLSEEIDELYLNGHPELRLPNTLNLGFAYVEGESLLLNFDMKGICVSTGSAC
ncbi:MAG: cysteine desulfurase, partial [Candidatus Omnitrophica bacterium]|nr:cysteine desulfurase [Candidatus Omnitrophota bacterium]